MKVQRIKWLWHVGRMAEDWIPRRMSREILYHRKNRADQDFHDQKHVITNFLVTFFLVWCKNPGDNFSTSFFCVEILTQIFHTVFVNIYSFSHHSDTELEVCWTNWLVLFILSLVLEVEGHLGHSMFPTFWLHWILWATQTQKYI